MVWSWLGGATGRQRQECQYKVELSLVYIPAWPTKGDPVSKEKSKNLTLSHYLTAGL